jgi:hypothetical protein
MPFIAECPYCKKGRLNCPDHVEGLSGNCPNPECGLSFTVMRRTAQPVTVGRRSPRLRTEQADQARASVSEHPGSPEPFVIAEQAGTQASDRAGSPESSENAHQAGTRDFEPAGPPGRFALNAFAAISLFLTAVALCWASVVEPGVVPMVIGGVAALVGLIGIGIASRDGRGVLLSLLGPGLGVLTVLACLLFPGLFDPLRAGRNRTPLEPDKGNVVIPLNTKKPGPTTIASGEIEWIDASKGVMQVEDLWLQVTGVSLEQVELEYQGRKQRTEQRFLVVRVQMANNGTQRRLEYQGWAETPYASNASASLRDGRGRAVPQHQFAGSYRVTGQLQQGFIMPGKHLDDVLVFEPPPEGFEYLRLELPLVAFGREGVARWQIPRGFVKVK